MQDPQKSDRLTKLFLDFSFQDLITLSQDEPEVFISLFLNRAEDFDRMKEILHDVEFNGHNVFIYGEAGIGKSNFIHRIFLADNIINREKIYPIEVDYNKYPSFYDTIQKFVDDINEYLIGVDPNLALPQIELGDGRDLHTIKKSILNSIDNINEHRSYFANAKSILIFLDDLDYAEDKLPNLLAFFYEFAVHKDVTMILTGRPQLLTSIQTRDLRYRWYFTTNVDRIELEPLASIEILASRLAFVLLEERCQSVILQIISRIMNIFRRNETVMDKYKRLLKKHGIDSIDELEKIELPFTHMFCDFLSTITNGNLREVFDIAYDALIFLKYNPTDTIIETDYQNNPTERRDIPESAIMELFFKHSNPNSKYYRNNYNIIDLHKTKIKGNSLYYNVLQAIYYHECTNPEFYQNLAELGLTAPYVNEALDKLESYPYRLITRQVVQLTSSKYPEPLLRHYDVTPKGRYYLYHVTRWDAYIKLCGKAKTDLETHYDRKHHA